MYCRISHQREKGPKSVLAPGYRSDVDDPPASRIEHRVLHLTRSGY